MSIELPEPRKSIGAMTRISNQSPSLFLANEKLLDILSLFLIMPV